MHIIIDHKEAVLKKGVSFDFIAENRFFTGADAYTLSISFPLKGCRQNLDIFGYINRKDCDLERLLLECEIHDRQFHAYGAVNIVEISELEVKTQFLMGRSVQNFSSDLDSVYINQLSIGPAQQVGHFECSHYFAPPGFPNYCGRVSLPWVNNTSGNMQNSMKWNGTRWYYGHANYEEDMPVSCQYFLIFVLKRVLEECGYTHDLSALDSSFFRFLVIFNTFPCAWDIEEWGLALPHWTVSEFLEQVELLTNGVFSVDAKAQKVSFRFNKDILDAQKVVEIRDIIDEHQVEISEKKDVRDSYLEQTNLKYADADHQMQNFYCCPWVLGTLPRISYATLEALRSSVSSYLTRTGSYGNLAVYNRVLYARDIDTYFVLRCFRTSKDAQNRTVHHMRLVPVNVFAPRIINPADDAKCTELGIVPVCIDQCDMVVGDAVFLECGTYGDVLNENEDQSLAVNTIRDGEPEKKEEYFDKLYVAYWNNDITVQQEPGRNLYPLPWIDNVWVNVYNTCNKSYMDDHEFFSLRLTGKLIGEERQVKHRIDQRVKYSFKFLVRDGALPDVQSIFLIHGKRYLAEKITATFSEDGMSQLVKMVCYRMQEPG